MSEHKTMTIAEIATVCQVDERTIRNWVAKLRHPDKISVATENFSVTPEILSIVEKAEKSSPMYPASFTFEETLAIIRAGNKPLADFMESNVIEQQQTAEAKEAMAWVRLFEKYGYTPEQLIDHRITEELVNACRKVPNMTAKHIKRLRLLINHRPFIKFSNKDIADHLKMSEYTVARISRICQRQNNAMGDCIRLMRSFGKTSMHIKGTALDSHTVPQNALPAPEATNDTHN